MAPALRVLISSSAAYPPTTPISVNSATPTPVSLPNFKGEVSVFVKDYSGEHVGGDGAAYFGKRSSMTYGIVVRGKYLDDPNGDEVLFGNVFERPIKDSLPWGTSVAVKFMNYVDPTLELDIYADKPWALSPAIACMNNISLNSGGKEAYIAEDSKKHLELDVEGDEKAQASARRKFLGNVENRRNTSLKDVDVGMEFANGLLDFNTLSATLPPPFHLSVPLLKYWDGQPVTYVCRRRTAGSPVTADGVYWSVGFEIIDEEAKKDLEKRGGIVLELGESGSGDSKGDVSDDVD